MRSYPPASQKLTRRQARPALAALQRTGRKSSFALLRGANALAVADLVDRARPVVGDQQRAVRRHQNIRGSAEIVLIALDPTRGEHLLLGHMLAVLVQDHADDTATLVLVAVPGAMLGDEDVVPVFGPELIAGVELHPERRHVGPQL